MTKASKFLSLLEVVKNDKDRWRVSVDDSSKSFTVYRGYDDICGGYFDPETKRIKDIEFMNPHYRKVNQIRQKAMDMIKKTFSEYK